nr:hypothetical protein [uncultured Sphingobacterium sp.]
MILEELTLEGPNRDFKAESDQLEGNILVYDTKDYKLVPGIATIKWTRS